MACSAPRGSCLHIFTDLRRFSALLVGIGCLVAGVILNGLPNMGPYLIPAGGLLLLLAVVWPAVTAIELGHPVLGKVALSTVVRRERLRAECEEKRRDLEICAAELWGDAQTSPELVEFAIEQAVSRWRGPQLHLLRGFLLCMIVQEAGRWELTRRPPESHGPSTSSIWSRQMARLSVYQRGLHLLYGRERLSAEAIATMMDRTATEIRAELAQIRATLATGGSLDDAR